jgi:hypothetical protein
VEELNFGRIIFMVGFIVLLLIRFLRQRARRRPQRQVPDQMVAEPSEARPPRQAHPPPPPPPSTPPGLHGRVDPSRVPKTPPALGEGHLMRKALLENPHDARRGIILMTLLGPCRAFDPPE